MSLITNMMAVLLVTSSAVVCIAQPAREFGPGIHLVGTDIAPGIYRTEGEITYFARLSGVSGEFDDIITNEIPPDGPVLVEIEATDIAFESKGSGRWVIVDESYRPKVVSSFGPGWWLVGTDIAPGLYRTEGGVSYFSRLSGLSAELKDIIANDIPSDGPAVIEIKAGDIAFLSKGKGTWYHIDASYHPQPMTTFGDGWWIVGIDILPGIYRTPDDVDYYERLSGFGDELDDIITNEAFSTGGAVIEIKATDAGFHTKGGATWTKINTDATVVQSAAWGEIKSRYGR